MARYQVRTTARHPNGTPAPLHVLTFYTDSSMGTPATLYAAEIGAGEVANPYTTDASAIVDFWTEDTTLWVLASGDTTVRPVNINLAVSASPTNILDYGAIGDGTTDDTDAIQTAINSCGTTGGIVYFPPGTYLLGTSCIHLPHSLTQRLTLSGYGATLLVGAGATSAGADPVEDPEAEGFIYAIHCNRSEDHQVFGHYLVEGFTVDCDDQVVSALAFSSMSSNYYMNFDDIIVRDVTVVNLHGGADAEDNYSFGLQINVSQSVYTTQNYITNILIENFRCEGGNSGVQITGNGNALDLLLDNIVLRNCWHDTGRSTFVDTVGANNYHIGGGGHGGALIVEDCTGLNSYEIGLETNGFEHAVIRGCVMRDFRASAYSANNYHAPAQGNGVTAYEACLAQLSKAYSSASLVANTAFEIGTIGSVTYSDCTVYYHFSTVNDCASAQYSVVRAFKSVCQNIVFSGLRIDIDYGTTPDNFYNNMMYLQPTGPTNVTIRDLTLKVRGTRTTGADRLALLLGHSVFYTIDGVSADYDVSGAGNEALELFRSETINGWSTTLLGVTARNIRATNLALGSPRVFNLDNTTLSGLFSISDCDLSLWAYNPLLFVFDASFSAKVRATNVVYPQVYTPYGEADPGSTVAYVASDHYDELVRIFDGTVSKIELARGDNTFLDIGATTGMFFLHSGDSLKVTHTGAPTWHIIPQP